MDQSGLWETAERLRQAADEAAGQVRSLYFTFLLVGSYIGVTIGSTTDEQLLMVGPVNLPLLNVGLPIVGFYALVPWFFLLLHFYLLLQLYLLASKLHPLDEALGLLDDKSARNQRVRLFPFPFTHMLIGRHHGRLMRLLLAMVVWVTVVLLPLILLVWAQIRFLPYHDTAITWSQRAVVALDLLMLWVFWPMILAAGGRATAWWRWVIKGPIRRARCLWTFVYQILRLITKPGRSRKSRACARWLRARWAKIGRADGCTALTLTSLGALVISVFITVLPGEEIERKVERIEERAFGALIKIGLLKISAMGWCNANAGEEFAKATHLTYCLFDSPGAPFHRSLRLAEKTLVAGEVSATIAASLRSEYVKVRESALQQVTGLNLANRDLRFADLHNAVLPNANLRGAALDGADLRQTILSGADFRPYDITDGGSCVQQAQEMKLEVERKVRSSIVYDARIREQQIAGISPTRENGRFCLTSLVGANLTKVDLPRSRLTYLQLRDAKLVDAQLKSADLRGTQLEDADLQGAYLQGADLRRIRGYSAKLNGAKLQAANLSEAHLQGAYLFGADLQGADLSSAFIQGGFLERAKLLGANLRKAQLQGAYLRHSDLRGARLKGANLRGADMWQADIRGADFSSVDLFLADLRDVKAGQFTDKDYEELKIKIEQAVEDEKQRKSILDISKKNIGMKDTLTRAENLKSAILGRLSHILPAKYDEPLVKEVLGPLACGEKEHPPIIKIWDYRSRISHRIDEARSIRLLLARVLLSPECPAVAVLPEQMKADLLKTIARAEAKAKK